MSRLLLLTSELSAFSNCLLTLPALLPQALVLLEYLVKNGAERVVDDARMHVSTIKILRNFHYVEPDTGKDVGVNVRTRAGELAELLADVDRIRAERRKARANRTKFAGGGGGGDFVPGSGAGRFAGFSSDQYFGAGGFSGGSASASGGADTGVSSYDAEYDEYDAGEDERPAPRSAGRPPALAASSSAKGKSSSPASAPPPAAPVADLLDWGDSDDDKPLRPAPGVSLSVPAAPSASAPAPAPVATAAAPAAAPAADKGKTSALDDFGDFGDFTTSAAVPAASSPLSAPALAPATKPAASPVPAAAAAAGPAPAKPALPTQATKANAAMFDFLAPSQSGGRTTGPMAGRSESFASSTSSLAGSKPSTPAAQPAKASAGGFDDLWASAGAKTTPAPKGPQTMAELAASRSNSAVWGGSPAPAVNKPKDVFDLI